MLEITAEKNEVKDLLCNTREIKVTQRTRKATPWTFLINPLENHISPLKLSLMKFTINPQERRQKTDKDAFYQIIPQQSKLECSRVPPRTNISNDKDILHDSCYMFIEKGQSVNFTSKTGRFFTSSDVKIITDN